MVSPSPSSNHKRLYARCCRQTAAGFRRGRQRPRLRHRQTHGRAQSAYHRGYRRALQNWGKMQTQFDRYSPEVGLIGATQWYLVAALAAKVHRHRARYRAYVFPQIVWRLHRAAPALEAESGGRLILFALQNASFTCGRREPHQSRVREPTLPLPAYAAGGQASPRRLGVDAAAPRPALFAALNSSQEAPS